MKPIKPVLFALGGLFIIILLIPTILVAPFMDQSKGKLGEELSITKKDEIPVLAESPVAVPVYRSQSKKIENIPLEEYVIGVVASEMPAEFETEALKAQALAARTYITKQLMNEQTLSAPEGSVVTDTQMHQVYKNPEELKGIWGKDYTWKLKKITEAVAATQGTILTYDNKPIDALFFSTSNGYTENSEAYWQEAFPYLKSVKSTWDQKSPKFYDQKIVSIKEFENKLDVSIGSDGSVGKITALTPGKRVATVEVDGKKFTGRDVREKLELKSSDFTWEIKGDSVVIETEGFGHGVGMSQYGANFMAEEGKSYTDIVAHYYKGTAVAEVEPFLTKYTAKK